MNNRNRKISENDSVLTELGDRVYREKINDYTYKDFYKDNPVKE